VSYLADAAERYPDVAVVATTEVASTSSSIADSGFSNEQISEEVLGTATALQSGGEEFLVDEIVGDVLTGGAITGVLGAAKAISSKGENDDIAGDIAKAAIRGLLFAFGLSFF
jgi:hypothetical protein